MFWTPEDTFAGEIRIVETEKKFKQGNKLTYIIIKDPTSTLIERNKTYKLVDLRNFKTIIVVKIPQIARNPAIEALYRLQGN